MSCLRHAEYALPGGAPDLRVPWVNHPALNYGGLIFAIGGRSLTWGGWSPELLDNERLGWPQATRTALRRRKYFAEASRADRGERNKRFHRSDRFIPHCASNFTTDARFRPTIPGSPLPDLHDHPRVRYTIQRSARCRSRCYASGLISQRPTRRRELDCSNCSS